MLHNRGQNFIEVWTAFEAMATRIVSIEAMYAQQRKQDQDRIEALEGQLAASERQILALTERCDRWDDAWHGLTGTVDHIRREQTTLTTCNKNLSNIVEAIDRDHKALAGVVENVSEVSEIAREMAGDLTDTVASLDRATNEQLDQVRLGWATTKGAVANCENDIRGAIDQTEALRTKVDGLLPQITSVNDGIASNRIEFGVLKDRVNDIEAGVSKLNANTGQLVEQVNRAAGQADVASIRLEVERLASRDIISHLPKSLLIDRDGDLIAIRGDGTKDAIGRVCGEDGQDGATIMDMSIVDGKLHVKMSDGRDLDAGELPIVEVPIDIEEAKKNKAIQLANEGLSLTAIAKQLGVCRQTASKWVKQDDEGKVGKSVRIPKQNRKRGGDNPVRTNR